MSINYPSISTQNFASTKEGNKFSGNQEITGSVSTTLNISSSQAVSAPSVIGDEITSSVGINTTNISSNNGTLNFVMSGDTYGGAYLYLKNSAGANGPIFGATSDMGADLIDFGFVTPTKVQRNIRIENRSANTFYGSAPETQIHFSEVSVPLVLSDTGVYAKELLYAKAGIEVTGNIKLGDNDGIIFGTGAGGTGTRISNTLSDYEEGTWIPNFYSFNGGTTFSYNVRYGKYTKIGNKVFIQGVISVSSTGSEAGTLYLASLPFAADTNAPYGVIYSPKFYNFSGSINSIGGLVGVASSTLITLTNCRLGSSTDINVEDIKVPSNTGLHFFGFYNV